AEAIRREHCHRFRRARPALVVLEDRGDLEVNRSGSGRRHCPGRLRLAAILLLVPAISLPSVYAFHPAEAQKPSTQDPSVNTEQAFRDARRELRRGHYDKAAKVYESILARAPENLRARLGMAFAQLKTSDYARCFDHASEAIKLDQNNA